MALLTIGAFARACRLTPKALRLYDELGLLQPAKTDPLTGYRWYAYLQRDGELLQLTHDDTLVQSMIDEGKLTSEEAESHPQRMILIRALHADCAVPRVRSHTAQLGDRYLLCSDGLHVSGAQGEIHRVLADHVEPHAAVAELATLVQQAGAPDNVVLVVADVLAA